MFPNTRSLGPSIPFSEVKLLRKSHKTDTRHTTNKISIPSVSAALCTVAHRDGLLSFIGPKLLPTPSFKPYCHQTHSYSPNVLTPPEDSFITKFSPHFLISHSPYPPKYLPLPHRTLEEAEDPRETREKSIIKGTHNFGTSRSVQTHLDQPRLPRPL